jgi:hypothetical protein
MSKPIEKCRTRPQRRRIAGIGALLFVIAGVSLDAYTEVSAIDWAVPQGSTPALLPKTVHALGITVDVQAFHIPHSISDVASHLQQQYPSLSRVPAEPPRVQIAGALQGQLGVITLEPDGITRTYATFSAMPQDPDTRAPSGSTDVSFHDDTIPPIWMPRHASLTMHVQQRDDNQAPITQQVWSLPISLQAAWQSVRQGLRGEGWVHEGSAEMAGHWRRERESLYLSLVGIEDGTAVYIQLTEGSTP